MTHTHKFHVVGMHCKSCVLLTETELSTHPDVHTVKAELSSCTVEISGKFGDKERHEIIGSLSELLHPHGYSLALERPEKKVEWADFKIALPLALAIILVFYFFQKTGIMNLVNVSSVSYGTAFVIGIIASLSTCMAVVGGLLLSMSASFAKNESGSKPQVTFHLGRIISFFLLGGVIGLIGSAFALSAAATFVLGIIIGVVMLILGLNLLGLFDWSKSLMPSMPKFLSGKMMGSQAPFVVGVATFFLPCGFTQAMQIYTLSTGSFLQGGLTMLAFALGTFPVLGLISFGSVGIGKSSKAQVFFKTAGVIVIAFALLNIVNSLRVIGLV